MLEATGPAIEEHTFESLVEGREEEFPNLARAACKVVPAHSIQIEWRALTDDGITETWSNYMQITRLPYTVPAEQGSTRDINDADDTIEEALTKFLRVIDTTLELGIPTVMSCGYDNVTTSGGWLHYLGRPLRDEDELILRPLRIPMLRTYEWGYIDGALAPLDAPKYEWLCETSLQVNPGGKESR